MAMHLRGEGKIMNTTYNTKTMRLIAALGVAAAAVVTPALLFASAGTAQADQVCRAAYDQGYLDGSFGGIGRCYQDQSQQNEYDAGLGDAQAGRQPNPPPILSMPQITGNSPTYDPNGPQTSMSPPVGNEIPWDQYLESRRPPDFLEAPEIPENTTSPGSYEPGPVSGMPIFMGAD
jgi:hypothetical protein